MNYGYISFSAIYLIQSRTSKRLIIDNQRDEASEILFEVNKSQVKGFQSTSCQNDVSKLNRR